MCAYIYIYMPAPAETITPLVSAHVRASHVGGFVGSSMFGLQCTTIMFV